MKKNLLTGATDGIGLATAKSLAAQGHHLLIHGRSESKLNETEKMLKNEFPLAKLECYQADLSKFDDVKTMMKSIVEAHQSIDILVNNAGVFKTPDTTTQDGLDVRFVVNTFAPYIIANTLLPILSEDGRIINLSSAAQAPISLAAMKSEEKISDAFQAYAQSKLAITIWTQELAHSLKPKQVAVAVNPGSMLASKMVKEGFGVAGNDLSIGADILVRAALSDEFSSASGKYYDNDSKAFSAPHREALDEQKKMEVMAMLRDIIKQYYGDLNPVA